MEALLMSPQPDATVMGPWPNRGLMAETNILIIAARPGEESRDTGGLIAELCRRGRPPFVTILTDGSGDAGSDAEAVAAELGAAARRAVGHLGLPAERLLLIGLHSGASTDGDTINDALVSAYDLLSWARDCQTICVPGDASVSADHALACCLGDRLSARAGLACVLSLREETAVPAGGFLEMGRIDMGRHLEAKARAQAQYPALTGDALRYEHFAVLRASAEPSRFWD